MSWTGLEAEDRPVESVAVNVTDSVPPDQPGLTEKETLLSTPMDTSISLSDADAVYITVWFLAGIVELLESMK